MRNYISILEALQECEEYFDQRADADCDQDGFIPNEELRLRTTVREALDRLPESTSSFAFAKAAMDAIKGVEADRGSRLPDDYELGRIEESSLSPSFRIRVGHIRKIAGEAVPAPKFVLKAGQLADLGSIRKDILEWLPESRSGDLFKAALFKKIDAAISMIEASS